MLVCWDSIISVINRFSLKKSEHIVIFYRGFETWHGVRQFILVTLLLFLPVILSTGGVEFYNLGVVFLSLLFLFWTSYALALIIYLFFLRPPANIIGSAFMDLANTKIKSINRSTRWKEKEKVVEIIGISLEALNLIKRAYFPPLGSKNRVVQDSFERRINFLKDRLGTLSKDIQFKTQDSVFQKASKELEKYSKILKEEAFGKLKETKTAEKKLPEKIKSWIVFWKLQGEIIVLILLILAKAL